MAQPQSNPYQKPLMPQPTVDLQAMSQSYQQPQMPPQQWQPTASTQPSPQPTSANKGSKSFGGIALLGIGVVLIVLWLIIKIANADNFDWYEGLIPLIYFDYPNHIELTILSFISPLLLWGGVLLALSGIGSFLLGGKKK
jgi:hypothetical protein